MSYETDTSFWNHAPNPLIGTKITGVTHRCLMQTYMHTSRTLCDSGNLRPTPPLTNNSQISATMSSTTTSTSSSSPIVTPIPQHHIDTRIMEEIAWEEEEGDAPSSPRCFYPHCEDEDQRLPLQDIMELYE